MGALFYSAICSVDGYIEDASGRFDWAAPDHEVHAFVNDLERQLTTYVYGRRMWETMRFWDDPPADDDPVFQDYARLWQAADKVVVSRTLATVDTSRTTVVRELDADLVSQLTAAGDVSIGGAEIAGAAMHAGLVDRVSLIVVPAVVGGGKPALPADLRVDLELLESRSFGNGTVYLSYRVRR